MAKKDPRVDAYIAKSPDFARPILSRIRQIVHQGCPGVEETIKWSVPHFDYHGPLAGMAAFKEYCSFGLWKGQLLGLKRQPGAMGHLGRIYTIKDLGSTRELKQLIARAAKLNEQGVKVPRVARTTKPVPKTPADLAAALKRNAKAAATFKALPPSHRREYIEWIISAKQDATRARRIDKAIAQIAEAKSLNWKYQI